MHSLTRILIPVNLGSHVWEPIEHGARLAAQTGAIAELLYVLSFDAEYQGPKAEEIYHNRLLSLVAMLHNRFAADPPDPENAPIFVGVMQWGDPTECIIEFASQLGHDVVVMGSGKWPGSGITEKVLQSAVSPVLIVPHANLVDSHKSEWSLPL